MSNKVECQHSTSETHDCEDGKHEDDKHRDEPCRCAPETIRYEAPQDGGKIMVAFGRLSVQEDVNGQLREDTLKINQIRDIIRLLRDVSTDFYLILGAQADLIEE